MLELVAEAAKGRARVLEVAAGTGLVRLVCDRDRDLDHEQQAAVNRARMMPWRR